MTGPGVVRVDSPDAVQRLRDRVIRTAARSVDITLPAGPYSAQTMAAQWPLGAETVARGIAFRGIYQADAVRSAQVIALLSKFARHGAQIRVAPRVRHRTLVADSRRAIVTIEEGMGPLPVLDIVQPALVAGFCARFEALWRRAIPISDDVVDGPNVERIREVLDVLRTGVTDEEASLKWGVSARTVRRRVAAVMDLLEAPTRFVAGAKAVREGWL